MTKAEFIQELAGVLMESPDNLKPDVELTSLETWDSTAVLGIIAILEGQVGVTVDVERIPECKTVQDVMNLAGDMLK
jgi:acyl carrier protein